MSFHVETAMVDSTLTMVAKYWIFVLSLLTHSTWIFWGINLFLSEGVAYKNFWSREFNQIIKFVKTNKSHITYPSLDLPSTKVIIYLDATFNNMPNGLSQGGIHNHADKNQKYCPISWKSNKVRRVASSSYYYHYYYYYYYYHFILRWIAINFIERKAKPLILLMELILYSLKINRPMKRH